MDFLARKHHIMTEKQETEVTWWGGDGSS